MCFPFHLKQCTEGPKWIWKTIFLVKVFAFFFFLDNFEKMCLCILTGNCLHLFVACDSVYVVSKNIFYAALLANSL